MDHFSSDQNLPVMIGIFLFNDSGFCQVWNYFKNIIFNVYKQKTLLGLIRMV